MEGTYPLPEAQLDRFFFKLKVTYPTEEGMHEILDRTTRDSEATRHAGGRRRGDPRDATGGESGPDCAPVQAYAIRLTLGTHPSSPYATPPVKEFVRYGASPRAAQAMVLAAKIHALNNGQAYVSVDDVRAVALPALRHRILLNFEGQAGEVSTDTIVETLLTHVATA
jgi:MoxR-like ATPase